MTPNFTTVCKIRVIENVRPGIDLIIYNDILEGIITLSWEPHQSIEKMIEVFE